MDLENAPATAIALAAIFVALLPVFTVFAVTRGPLVTGAVLLTLLAGLVVVGGLASGNTFTAVAGIVGGTTLWACALICGIAALLDARAEARARDMTFRIIHGDARGLPVPPDLKGKAPPER